MLNLSSIQESYLKDYLSLEHLRAVIHQSKLNNNKTKRSKEKVFYGVTCSQDVLSLLKTEEGKGHIVNCYLLHPVTKTFNKVDYCHLIAYLEYLAYLQVDPETFRYKPESAFAYAHYCEIGSYEFENENFYFLRAEIENILNVRIPYFDDVKEVKKVDLIPLNEGKEESTEDLNKKIESLKLELEEKDKKIEELQKKNDDKKISGKSETSYLNMIQSLKDVCLSENRFKNQDELIAWLANQYQGYTGLSEANLRDKFSKANRIK